MAWTHQRLREEFLNFFQEKGHKIFPSSSLTNSGDPSVLLTTAGMQQFKPYYLDPMRADKELGGRRAACAQKCFRTTDIDEVGDETHNTFFEMLGNFSFGDYFKKEAIEFAFELLTKRYTLNAKRFTVTVFGGDKEVPRDEESVHIWEELEFSEKKGNFTFAGKEDNFWGPTGDEGPCGPTTEIYLDGVEVWNIVFNEFYFPGSRDELLSEKSGKNLKPLAHKGVDTGIGFERLARVLQNVPTSFETDVFSPLLDTIKTFERRGDLPEEVIIKARRIIADHMKGASFLMAEGLEPSNVKAGYILRRILRRAMRFGHTLGLPYQTFFNLIKATGAIYKDVYPELFENQKKVFQIFEKEYNIFGKTLKKGMTVFEKMISKIRNKVFPGDKAFFLHATYGFPVELVEEMTKERGFTLEKEGFAKALEAHRQVSKKI